MPSLRKEPERPKKQWRVDWTGRDRRRHTKRFVTRSEAQVFIADLLRGTTTRAERMTLDEWLARWITTHGLAWEPRTRRDRAKYADRLITPHLGAMRLSEIGRSDVRDWRAGLIRAGKTPYVADRAVTILSAALGAAVDDDLIPANPCRGLKRLPRAVDRRRPATLAEVEAIRAAMIGPHDRLVVSLMAYAGLRPSEVRSLQWGDVRDNTIVVRSAARDGGGTKARKSGGVAVVPIIEALREDLLAVVADGEGRRAAVPAGLVVPIPDWRNWTSRVWRPARRRAGADVPPYALRHTFASLLIAEGRNPWQVAALLGHANPAMVISTYGHLFAEQELAEKQVMEEAVKVARLHAASIPRHARRAASTA